LGVLLVPVDAADPMDSDDPVAVEVPELENPEVDLANPVNPVEMEDSVDWADPEEVEDPIELGARLDPVEEDLGNLDAKLKP
jgi:hypothetical protein